MRCWEGDDNREVDVIATTDWEDDSDDEDMATTGLEAFNSDDDCVAGVSSDVELHAGKLSWSTLAAGDVESPLDLANGMKKKNYPFVCFFRES